MNVYNLNSPNIVRQAIHLLATPHRLQQQVKKNHPPQKKLKAADGLQMSDQKGDEIKSKPKLGILFRKALNIDFISNFVKNVG